MMERELMNDGEDHVLLQKKGLLVVLQEGQVRGL